MGMQTMRDRAAAIGGRLSISSRRGTVIECECHNRFTQIAIDRNDAAVAENIS
jgi:signal transduction histidine kinase